MTAPSALDGTPDATQPDERRETLPGLMSVDQVADRLGTGRRFVYRLVEERRLPHSKVGRHLRFESADVEAYIAAVTSPAIRPPLPLTARARAS